MQRRLEDAEARRVWIDSFPRRLPLCLVHKILNLRPCHPVAEVVTKETLSFTISKNGGIPPVGEIKITEIGDRGRTPGFRVVEYSSQPLYDLLVLRLPFLAYSTHLVWVCVIY